MILASRAKRLVHWEHVDILDASASHPYLADRARSIFCTERRLRQTNENGRSHVGISSMEVGNAVDKLRRMVTPHDVDRVALTDTSGSYG